MRSTTRSTDHHERPVSHLTPEHHHPWDEHAAWWQAEFTDGADPEYSDQILPLIAERLPSRGLVVDVGCGEGQVARLAAASGLDVIGVDPSGLQVGEAQRRGGGPRYLRGSAAGLALREGIAEAAVACLVFEHIDDLDAAIDEVARVLVPGGRFLFLLNHPLLQTPNSGWIDDQILDPPEQYWRVGEYLNEAVTMEEVTAGVYVRFLHRPLGRYLNSLRRAGLVLEEFVEPAPPSSFLARAEEYEAAQSIPRLLLLDLRKSRNPRLPYEQ
ncbi:MAG: class I SAM-dependent methyltransferase [Microthrixaceae bacterium]|nr:class I SAM-dependent methyltransferase [Microthrixaceae bacterium]